MSESNGCSQSAVADPPLNRHEGGVAPVLPDRIEPLWTQGGRCVIPNHLRKLRASELSNETIISNGIYSETDARQIRCDLGRQSWPQKNGSVLNFVYRDADGNVIYRRSRPDNPPQYKRQLAQQQERRARGIGDAAELAGLHRDPAKRFASIVEEEKSLATKAGGLEARLVAQEQLRRKLFGQRTSDEEFERLQSESEQATRDSASLRKKKLSLETKLANMPYFLGGDPQHIRAAKVDIRKEIADIDEQLRSGVDFQAQSAFDAAKQNRTAIDAKTKASLEWSERTQAELSGVRGAQSKLSGDRIRTEFELSDDRLRLLGSLDRMFRDDERLDHLPPHKRMREEKKRKNDPRIVEQRDELFKGLEKHGFQRESIDSRDEVRAILEADRKRREALEDAEVKERRKQIEATNAAKDATEDFGNAAEEFAAKMIEVADKTVPALDRAYKVLELIEKKIAAIEQALQNK